jgi:preprotein translocase subunit SecD
MGKLILNVLMVALVASAATAADQVRVTFRLASREPLPGWEETSLADGADLWYLAPEVLLDQSLFAVATAQPGDGETWVVDVSMTAAGRERLAELTREHVGERLGMVVDGRLVTAPVIRAPLTEGRALIVGSFDATEARRIAAGVMAGR